MVDVEADRYVPSVEAIMAAVTPKTRMIWLANLVAFSGHRATAADTRDRIDRATRRVVTSAARPAVYR